jgi:hypothetical protein
MRAADLTAEHIGQTITVEVDYGDAGRISATGELIQASHEYSPTMIDGEPVSVLTTEVRLMFTDTQTAEIIVHSDDEVQLH